MSGPTPDASLTSRRLDIQGLRAVAVLMVVLFHAGFPMPGGFAGVDVFFVVSGFVITAMLVREIEAHGRVRMGRFYLRRFKRLTPALALTVAVTMVGAALIQSPLGTQQRTAATGVGALTLVANVVIERTTGGYFDLAAASNALLNTWSLSVEEQFYLAFPLLLVIAWAAPRRTGNRSVPVIFVAVVSVGSFAPALLGSGAHVTHPLVGFYSPVSRAWEFGVGALLALVPIAHRLGPAVRQAAGGMGVLALAASVWVLEEGVPYPGWFTLLPVVGTLLLLAVGAGGSWVSRVLSWRPVVLIGDWSYSIYLWHWPMIVFASTLWPGSRRVTVLAAACSCVPAVASYYWLEEPLRRMSINGARDIVRMVSLTVVPPLLIATGLWVGGNLGFGVPEVQRYQRDVLAAHAGVTRGCHLDGGDGPRDLADCVWNGEQSGVPVYLVGDSNADHFSEGLIEAGRRLGRPVTVSTASACPFIDLSLGSGADPESNVVCRGYVQTTMRRLLAAEPGTVVISNGDSYWPDPGWVVRAADGRIVTDEPAKLSEASARLAGMIHQLRRAGHRVLVVQAVPVWNPLTHPWAASECSLQRITGGQCAQTMTVDEALAVQAPTRSAVQAAADMGRAEVVDPWASLCPGGECQAVTPEVIRYQNRDHITVPQSFLLTDLWESALRA